MCTMKWIKTVHPLTISAFLVVAGIHVGVPRAEAEPAIRTTSGCRAKIVKRSKRKRCVICVRAGNVFQRQGVGVGFCRAKAVAPAPAVAAAATMAVVAADTIHLVGGCRKRLARLPKRKRCIACVNLGMVFQSQGTGAGFCRDKVPPKAAGRAVTAVVVADTIHTQPGCRKRLARAAKIRRCRACIKSGMVFQSQGAGVGFCRDKLAVAPPPAPPPVPPAPLPSDAILAVAGCRARIVVLPKRKRCIACVNSGHVFRRQGMARGFCEARAAPSRVAPPPASPPPPRPPRVAPSTAPPPPVVGVGIKTTAGCRARIAFIPKRGRCIRCIRTGRVFLKRGKGVGVCRK